MATIGSYKGVQISGGTDAQVASQIAAINSGSATAPASGGTATKPNLVVAGAPTGFDIAPGSSLSGNLNYGTTLPASANVNPVITPNTLTPTTPIPLPATPQGSNYLGALLGGNLGLGINTPSSTTTTTKDAAGNVIPNSASTATGNSSLDASLGARADIFKAYINDLVPQPNLTNEYLKLEQDTGVAQKQQVVNDLTAQLNSITAGAQADKLSLTGQGRGIPEPIIGGQQAEIDKEAAIKALPVQAQLAAAQGNLKFAQDRLDTLFKLKSEDLTNDYNYKKDVRDATYTFLTDQQKMVVDAHQKEDDRLYQQKKDNLTRVDEWSKLALTNGAPSLIGAFAKLDPSSPTFEKDFGALQKQVPTKPVTTKLTVDERASAALSKFSSAFTQGAKLKDGTNILDTNGFVTPVAWRQAISDAPAEGLTRSEFIKQFGYLLYSNSGTVSPSYGLTPAEEKIINGALPSQ